MEPWMSAQREMANEEAFGRCRFPERRGLRGWGIRILAGVVFHVALLAAGAPFAAGQGPEAPVRLPDGRERLVVGGGDQFFPLMYVNAQGKAEGMHVDLWRLWSRETGVEVEFRLMDWAKTLPALERGEVDVVHGVTYTPARVEYLEFSEPFFGRVATYIFYHKELDALRTVEDLVGFAVGVLEGTNTVDFLRAEDPDVHLVPFPTYKDLVGAAVDDTIRVFVAEEPLVAYYLARAGRTGDFLRSPEALIATDLRFAVRKGDTELLAMISRGMEALPEAEKQRIASRYEGVHIQAHPYWDWVVRGGVALVLLAVAGFGLAAWMRHRVKVATRSLRRSEERFRSLVETMSDWIWEADASGVYTYASPRVQDILGYAPEEMVGKGYFDFMPPEEAARIRGEFEKAREEGRPLVGLENLNLRKDGQAVYLETSGVPILDEKGRVAGYRGVDRDITPRKRAVEELRESEERFRELTENIKAVFWLTEADSLRVVYCSPAYERIFGRPVSELYADPENWIEGIVPDDRERAAASFRLGAREGEYNEVYRVVRSDGSVRWIRDRAFPIRDAEGRVWRIAGLAEDITEQRMAEEALEKESAFRRAIVEKATEGLCVCHPIDDFPYVRFTVWNKRMAEITGYSMEEINRLGWYQTVYPDSEVRARAVERMKRMQEGQDILGEEWVVTRKDGEQRTLSISTTILDIEDQKNHVLALMYDITDRKRAETERRSLETRVQHAQKLESLGILAGGIAHDFNNLLMSILGNADLALMDLPPGSPAHSCIESVISASHSAADLCRQLLAYSGKGKFDVRPVDLSVVAAEMLQLAEVGVSRKVKIQCDLKEGLPRIEADLAQMRQVVLNLITNASEAIGDREGLIHVSTGADHFTTPQLKDTWVGDPFQEGQYVYVEVKDTGCGMDDNTRRRLFEPFFTTKFAGRGLGMAAVLGIVRGHRGAIFVKSEPGKGTTFRVLFPAPETPLAHLVPKTPAPGSWQGKGTVLLADDEETVRNVGKRMLERLGFQVLSAEDGQAALDLYRSHAEDITCVILDLTMPRLSGEEVWRQIAGIRDDMPVILSSGYSEQAVAQPPTPAKRPAVFLQKPYTLEKLVGALKKALPAASVER